MFPFPSKKRPVQKTDSPATLTKVEHTADGPRMVPDLEASKQIDALAAQIDAQKTDLTPTPEN